MTVVACARAASNASTYIIDDTPVITIGWIHSEHQLIKKGKRI